MNEFLHHLFRTSYDTTEWFVAFQKAVNGLSQEQAKQKLTSEGDSIYGIVAHLVYWNERYLKKMNGQSQNAPMIENNELTFQTPNDLTWQQLLRKAEEVSSGWNKKLSTLSEKDNEHYNAIGNTAMHNAYHIGQIVMLRKLQESWNKEEGVK
jgi:uncharacterized damage-inducible protein DinB